MERWPSPFGFPLTDKLTCGLSPEPLENVSHLATLAIVNPHREARSQATIAMSTSGQVFATPCTGFKWTMLATGVVVPHARVFCSTEGVRDQPK